jgi:hypothetical protein
VGGMVSSRKARMRSRKLRRGRIELCAMSSRVGICRWCRQQMHIMLCGYACRSFHSSTNCKVGAFGVPARACSASAALRVCTIGYFQPDEGQFGCISCDIILGDFYQELSAQSSCVACPPSTKRFVGVLTAATKSSCQCKEGDVAVERALSGSMDCDPLLCRLLQQGGPVRRGTMPLDLFAPTTSWLHLSI